MFSKALFKQSVKANGLMWGIITAAVCFMLSCVMLISGSGNISQTKDAVENTIIQETIDGSLKEKAVSNYAIVTDSLDEFDRDFVKETKSKFSEEIKYTAPYAAKCDTWLTQMPSQTSYGTTEEYMAALGQWKASFPAYGEDATKYYAYYFNEWMNAMPNSSDYGTTEEYVSAVQTWKASESSIIVQSSYAATVQNDIASVYLSSISDVTDYIKSYCLSIDPSYDENSDFYTQAYGSTMFTINPNGQLSEMYESYEKGSTPGDYDVKSILENVTAKDLALWATGEEGSDVNSYISSDDRMEYRQDRAEESVSILISGSMFEAENKKALLDQLAEYSVTEEKFDSFGYSYDSVKHMCKTAEMTYQTRLDYELSLINEGDFASHDEYLAKVKETKSELASDITNTLLQTLPEEVSSAIEEIGRMDLYSLIVGSIFFKMAGLLLPIIYMIMASNNLIAGQVDSGSMAYVLSTSTKRRQVVFTQAVFLISSLFLMFTCTTITSCICFSQVHLTSSSLTYGKLILMNLGAFLVLFAMSGINFFTSCWFDRSKRSMAVGGGLSMFFLVATMLGLFGSEVIPSVVRLSALNNFNYVSIISFFDTISIIDGTGAFIWKFFILAAIGLLGYIVGSERFVKKDLPL